MEKKLDGHYTRMLRTILNKSWRQQPTKQQLYGHLPPITKTMKVRRTRHAGHCWRSRDELIRDVLLWTLHMNEQRQDDQLEPIYSSSVLIRDVILKTCRKQWTIGRGGERGSGLHNVRMMMMMNSYQRSQISKTQNKQITQQQQQQISVPHNLEVPFNVPSFRRMFIWK